MKNRWLVLAMLAAFGCDDGDPDPMDAGGDEEDSGGVTTPTCAAYCAEIQGNCTGANSQYGDMATCMASCPSFPVGTGSDMAGNTLGCRIYHAGAADGDPGTHCVHAGPGGGGACGDPCDGFCAIAEDACTGANEQFADNAACMTACEGFTDDDPFDTSDTDGDNLSCRLYHLTVAATSDTMAGLHCDHIPAASDPCM
jgi:hypothetical protein